MYYPLIILHKKKVPYDWQVNRFKEMFRKLIALEQSCDVHIIAGDIFDKKPEPDEICLFLSYINSVTILDLRGHPAGVYLLKSINGPVRLLKN